MSAVGSPATVLTAYCVVMCMSSEAADECRELLGQILMCDVADAGLRFKVRSCRCVVLRSVVLSSLRFNIRSRGT